MAVCRRVLRDEELAADAAQEAMLSIARHIRTFDGRSRYTTWSYRIAVNAALDEARRAGRRKTLPLKETAVEETISFEGAVSTRIGVAQALERLPAEQSEALRLRHGLDLDYAAIAEILHVPIGTVRSRLARGRVQLAALLRDEDRAISRLERNRPSSGDVEELT